MRLILFLLLCLVLTPASDAQFRTSFEASAGVSLNQLSNQNEITVLGLVIPGLAADYPLAAGISGEVRARLGSDRLAMRLGVGALSTGTVFDVTTRLLGRDDLSVSFVTANLEAEVGERFGPAHVYLFAGPELRYLVARSDDERALALGDVNRYHTALSLGIGTRFRAGPITLGPEVTGSLGLARFAEDEFSFFGQRLVLEEGFKLDNLHVGLTLGTRF